MRRVGSRPLLAVVLVVLAAAGVAVVVWQRSLDDAPRHPQITASTHGQVIRVGPYRYCDVIEVTRCDVPETIGELDVSSRDPIELSVPPPIARAPWVLLRDYEGSGAPVVEEFRPGERPAVTIPTVDPRYGRLTGLAVQLPTLVRDEAGNVYPYPHAEWSVRTVWN